MPSRFTVLASGSTGNASLLEDRGHTVLIDFGLTPRKLSRALGQVGKSFSDLRDVLLTHLHGDHWNEDALARLGPTAATLWCHAEHAGFLEARSEAFRAIQSDGRVRRFELGQPFACGPCRVTAFAVEHDTFTCGFRLEGGDRAWAIGFASDLGSWTDEVTASLSDVDVLAVEFNHDVALQQTSRRHPWLIRRNLGDGGHLSNAQAARLLGDILDRTPTGRLRHLIPLHLSRQCNRPELAIAAAEEVRLARGAAFAITPADAHVPLPWIELGATETSLPPAPAPRRRRRVRVNPCQPFFPGWD